MATRLAQPHPFALSAQIVNSPIMGMQQYHYGALHPFLPDPEPAPSRPARETWRPSEDGLFSLPASATVGHNQEGKRPLELASPYDGHPWLLLSNATEGAVEMLRTPVADWAEHRGENIAWGPGWKSWAVAAQQQYSLLRNLELRQMARYHFGRRIDYGRERAAAAAVAERKNTTDTFRRLVTSYSGPGGENLYDTQYRRYNLNFLVVWGHDVREAALPVDDDELELTQKVPQRTGRPFVIDTRAIVAHHSFGVSRDTVSRTDLMDRFRALANEGACAAVPGVEPKKPFDPRCDGF